MNKEITVLIIEDEEIAAKNLISLIAEIDSNILVLAKIESVSRSISWLSENQPDLIFMDIHLSDGICFNIFEKIKINTPIIFITAYEEYALKAFKLNSIDYLLKPINKNELQTSIEKFKDYNNKSKSVDFDSIKDYFLLQGKKIEYKQRFLVTIGTTIKIIEVADILFFYVDDKGVYIRTIDNKNYLADNSLDKLEFILDPTQFYRINRKYLIHIKSIKELITMSKSRLKLKLVQSLDDDIYVSFNKTADFKKWLNQ